MNEAHILCRHFALVYERFRQADAATQARVAELARVVNDGATADVRQAATEELATVLLAGQVGEPKELTDESTFGRRVAAMLRERG